jgi:hypothetical protein
MSDNDFLFQRFGDVQFPIEGVRNAQLFSVLDPARDRLLAFFKAAINQELAHSTTSVVAGSPWAIVRANTILSNAMPVQDVAYLQPTGDLMKESGWGMPLLCLYRTSAIHEEFSLQRELIRTTWGFDYILPPLAADERRKLAGMLPGVRALISLLIRKRSHPAYQNGQLQFGQNFGGFDTMKVVSSNEGPAQFSDQSGSNYYYAVHFDMETTELDNMAAEFLTKVDENGNTIVVQNLNYSPLYTDFAGVDVSAGLSSPYGTLPDAVQARTDTNPDPNYSKV